MRRVVVTGMGIVSSIGNTTQEVLTSLREAKSGITKAEDYEKYGFRCQVHGKPTLNPEELVDRRAMRFHGLGTAWNHVAMDQAIADSGLSPEDISHERTGIIMGSGGPSTRTLIDAADITREKGPKRIGPFAVPKAMSSTASATLATWFKIKGVNYSISSACATSNHCIGNAFETIQMGKQDIMFAGGCEDLDWSMSNLFDAMGAMSSKYNETPSTASRTYDANRDGFVIAGGAGVLVLEELEHALARGAKIYGEIVGYGATSDGYDMVAPSGEGAVRCMRMALQNVTAPIDYINPHGTSTPVGDLKEIEAIREVFGAGEKCPPISATKSLTGHSLRNRCAGGDLFALDDEQRLHLRECAYRRTRSGARRHEHCSEADRRRQARYGPVQFLRLRRHQRDACLQPLQRLRRHHVRCLIWRRGQDRSDRALGCKVVTTRTSSHQGDIE
ncbi:MAG: beta-ketoacyl-ACP synthase [Microvirga sp.]|nr:beta-ketoacyl-ACP synthase [Microvirga sp.]